MRNGKKKISLLSVLLSLVLHATGTNIDNLVAALSYRSSPSALSGVFQSSVLFRPQNLLFSSLQARNSLALFPGMRNCSFRKAKTHVLSSSRGRFPLNK